MPRVVGPGRPPSSLSAHANSVKRSALRAGTSGLVLDGIVAGITRTLGATQRVKISSHRTSTEPQLLGEEAACLFGGF